MGKPAFIMLSGEKFNSTVLKVIEKDPDGSPRKFELLRDDEATNIQGGEEFWVVYASEKVLRRKKGGNS